MLTVKITCDTGNTWATEINASFSDAVAYFLGKKFTREDESGRETVDTVTMIELDHHKHGRYFLHFDGEVYCITRDGIPTAGGYYSLPALFKAKF